MSGPFDRSPAASAPSSGHLVNGNDDEQAGLNVWLDDHNPGALTALGLDHESALHNAGLEPGGSLQHSADIHFGHASLFHAQFGVAGERKSQFHHSGKVGIEPLSRLIVAPGHTLEMRSDFARHSGARVDRPLLNQHFKRGNTEGEQGTRARCSP